MTLRPTAAQTWVAAPSLNTHCEAIEHNEAACTQALKDDMPSMHQPNLHPLLPYEMHLLYVIMPFEAHRLRDISSTSVFGQLFPSVPSTACGVIGSFNTTKGASLKPFNHTVHCVRIWLRLKQGSGSCLNKEKSIMLHIKGEEI